MSSMGSMSMGSMSMGNGVPSMFTLQKMYWAVVGSAIGIATFANGINRLLARQRLQDVSSTPAKPKSAFWRAYASITAILREISYASPQPIQLSRLVIHFPPLGPVLIVLANLVSVIVLCFYGLDTTDVWEWENIGYRTGFISICQLPLIFLLAGRQNIIGYLVDMSYARLNWFHRWSARTLWLSSTIHMGFWFRDWGRYDYIAYQVTHDPLTKRGLAAWCILTFIVVSSSAPVRRLSYETFVLQHLVSFIGLLVSVWMHAPEEVKIWVWISIGLVVFDRVARYTWGAYINLSIFHGKTSENSTFQCHATLTSFPGNVTRVTIPHPSISWKPGQHAFLTCHRVALFQSHPFTIASLPEDNQIEFFIRAQNGGTKRFLSAALEGRTKPGPTGAEVQKATVFIDGPYGTHRSLRQFDSVVLMAGGMGATFVIPLLRDIVSSWNNEHSDLLLGQRKRLSATRSIRFVWAIKSRLDMAMFESRIYDILSALNEYRCSNPGSKKQLDIEIYVTGNEIPDPLQAQSGLPPSSQECPSDIQLVNITKPIHIKSAEHWTCSQQSECTCTCHCTGEILRDQKDSCPSSRRPPAHSRPKLSTDSDHYDTELSQLLPIEDAAHPTILSGRPAIHSILSKTLENAEGESAVVVCGPRGLADDVRRCVVSLSDERAVHKGTGAQGIYLHVENFGL